MDCDYVQLDDHSFWILHGYWNMIGTQVFKLGNERFNPLTRKHYDKVSSRFITEEINSSSIVNRFCPKKCFRKKKNSLQGVWKKIGNALSKIVGEDNVGIMGSTLIGFPLKKDVDFIVYGKKNCAKIQRNIDWVKGFVGASEISNDHVKYQVKKYGSFHNTSINSFQELLRNKWSSLQIDKGILSTIRFAYKEKEFPENPWQNPSEGLTTVSGVVVDAFGTSFCPRTFIIRNSKGLVKIASYFWAYHQCVKKGDKVFVTGNKREGFVTVDTPHHGIKVLA